MQLDNSFHPVVLYETYLICIFMNINEILKYTYKITQLLICYVP